MADIDTGTADQERTEQSPEQVLQAQIDTLVGKAVKSDNGLVFDADALKDISPEVAFAAKAELRVRNTQKSYTKTRQELSKTTIVNQQLKEKLITNASLNLSAAETKELNTLKINDPESWRTKLAGYEARAKTTLEANLNEIEQSGATLSEVEVRKAQLASFNETTGLNLTDDMIANELPASYLKAVEKGESTFDEFLTKAAKFLKKNKVILGADKDEPDNDPDLSNMTGASEPSEQAIDTDIIKSYKKVNF